jgi:hypothetical protein
MRDPSREGLRGNPWSRGGVRGERTVWIDVEEEEEESWEDPPGAQVAILRVVDGC